jgi:hypothetical protein
MPNPRTPSTSDFSNLETQERNDNTTLQNTVPEVPDNTNGNEFEVERRNEVYPDQSQNHSLTEENKQKNDASETSEESDTKNKDDEDWDITKKK